MAYCTRRNVIKGVKKEIHEMKAHTPSLGRLNLRSRIVGLTWSILLRRADQMSRWRGSSAVLITCGIESLTVAIFL